MGTCGKFMNDIRAALVIDFGTSNVHVSVIDCEDGKTICSHAEKYTMYHPSAQMSVLRPEEVFKASENGVRAVMHLLPADVTLCVVSFSYFGDSIMAVDKDGVPMTDLMLCFDARGVAQVSQLAETLGRRHIELTGEPCTFYSASTKLLWLRENKPQIFETARGYWSIQQYILSRLHLPALCDCTMAARYSLFDNKYSIWSEECLNAVGIDETLLPETVESTQIIGTLCAYGDVKLPRELPVVIGAHDCECGIIGTGAFDAEHRILADITGTYDHMGLICDGYVNPMALQADTLACGARGPFVNSSTCSASFDTAGSALEWFMCEINENTTQDAYREMWQKVKLNGEGRLFVVPDFIDARGKIIGLSISNNKHDLFEAVIEGITFEVKTILDSYMKFWKNSFEVVRIGGGLARAEQWMQLRADIFGRSVECMRNIEVSTVGAAILGAVAAGLYENHEKAAQKMIVVAKSYEPNRIVCERYAEKYKSYLRVKN